MARNDKDMLQDIMDDLIDRMVGVLVDRKEVTLPAPIRVTRHPQDRS